MATIWNDFHRKGLLKAQHLTNVRENIKTNIQNQSPIIIINYWEFFSPVLSGGSLLKSEWQQVFSGPPGLSLLSLSISTVLWSVCSRFFLRFLFSPLSFPGFLVEGSKCTSYKWYYRHRHILQILQLSVKIQVFVWLSAFFYFHWIVRWNNEIREIKTFIFH